MKLKDDKGSVLALAIVGVALLGIFFMTISMQINNQIKSNDESYEDMKYKYMAESGIEKAIYDIEKDIKESIDSLINISDKEENRSSVDENHKNCPKVKFENGMPFVLVGDYSTENGNFSKLVYADLTLKSNAIYNSIYQGIHTIFGENYFNQKIRDYYQIPILSTIANTAGQGAQHYNHSRLEGSLNEYIKMLDIVAEDVKKLQGNHGGLLNDLNKMKEIIIETKCRLGMSIGGNQVSITDKEIKVPEYKVDLDGNKLESNITNSTHVSIQVKIDGNGELEDVILDDLNDITVNNSSLKSQSKNKKIESKVEFIFEKNERGYDIKYKINSYEQKSK